MTWAYARNGHGVIARPCALDARRTLKRADAMPAHDGYAHASLAMAQALPGRIDAANVQLREAKARLQAVPRPAAKELLERQLVHVRAMVDSTAR